ncbi:MAG: transposase [Candidatus Bathyarchaeota archaeon]|nr:transposase [Candidatus Bathyarchaeota archaeon]
MTITQRIVECNTHKQIVNLVDSQAKATLREWKRKLIEGALEHLVTKYHGPKWLKIRERKPTPWICFRCGPRESNQVKRNGHYRRYLIVKEGVICIRVPQLECLSCGKQITLDALFLPKRKRYWIELDRKITELYLSGASYRQVKAILDRAMEWDCGLMSLWRRFQKMAKKASSSGLGETLKVLYLDEAYTKVKGKPYWSLLALGEGKSGKRAYLGAVLSPDKSEASWISLLEALEIPDAGRGLLVVHDGDQAIISALSFILPKAKSRLCAWHKLHNLFFKAKELFPNNPEKVRQIIKEAKARQE